MRFHYESLRKSQIGHCKDCGAEIAVITNRNGMRFPVDVLYDNHGNPEYKHHGGNHNNYTPWHVCKKPEPVQAPQETGLALRRLTQEEVDELNKWMSEHPDDPGIKSVQTCIRLWGPKEGK